MDEENKDEQIKKATFKPYKNIFFIALICIICLIISATLGDLIRPLQAVGGLAIVVVCFDIILGPLYVVISGIITIIKCIKSKANKKYIIINSIAIIVGIIVTVILFTLLEEGMSI